jgi:cleavage and polyadenylation specificity factor subunit 4
MDDLVSSALARTPFDFEWYVKERLGLDIDGTGSGQVCRLFLRGACLQGSSCPQKHTYEVLNRYGAEKTVVCKHWLRGLCKKGDDCEFLHEYNLKKMPDCWFFTKYGECHNQECLYLHIDPNSKLRQCPWYARGFCKHGPLCRNKHARNTICQLYLSGFCPFGPNCQMAHPRYDIPTFTPSAVF